MAFDIIFYNNSAEENRLDKTNYLSNPTTFTGTLRAECSITSPEIIIESATVPNFNYAYIAAFDRYYFVSSGITSVNNNLWRVPLKCDVLMSHKTGIKTLDVIVARQEFDYNEDLNDPEFPCEAEPDVQIVDIPSDVFDVTESLSKKYLLTVIGAA